MIENDKKDIYSILFYFTLIAFQGTGTVPDIMGLFESLFQGICQPGRESPGGQVLL